MSDVDNRLLKLTREGGDQKDDVLHDGSISKKRYSNSVDTNSYFMSNQYPQLTPVLRDTARPERYRKARHKDWVYYQNSYGIPKDFNEDELRVWGESWAVQRCKSVIIDEVISAQWEIVPTNKNDNSIETIDTINKIKTFFNATNRHGHSLKKILRPFLNDVLDLGYGVMVKTFHKDAYTDFHNANTHTLQETRMPHQQQWSYVSSDVRQGFLRDIETFDSSGFHIQPDPYGAPIGWWQRISNGIPEFFSKREIVSLEAYDVSYRSYPLSPVKIVATLIKALSKAVANTDQYLDDGAIPPGMLALSGISAAEFKSFKARWDAKYKGNPSEIPLVSAGNGDIKFIPLVVNTEDIKQLELTDVYSKIAMSVFHVTPDELGITETSNRSVGDSQERVMKRAAIFPYLDKTEDMINRSVIKEIDADGLVKFQWIKPKSIEEEEKEWGLMERKLNAGYYTINDLKDQKAEIMKQWGHVPFSLPLWTQLVSEFDPTLLGLREEKESEEQAKLDFTNRQLMYLLEQLQYDLNNDRDLTASAITTLVKLRMMQEALNIPGTLSSPPSSIVENEAIIDAANSSNNFTNTQDIFNYRGDDKSAKGVRNAGDDSFFRVQTGIMTRIQELAYEKRMLKNLNPVEKALFRALKFIGRQWWGKIGAIADMLFAGDRYVSPDEVDQSLTLTLSRDEFKGVVSSSFKDAYMLGYATNNEGKISTKVRSTDIDIVNPEAKKFLDNRSLLFADKRINSVKDKVKQVIDDGMSQSPRLSAVNIRNNLRAVIPVERMEGETQEAFKNRQKFYDRSLMRIARTEVARAQNQGRMQQLRDLGATHFEYYAFIDDRNKDEPKFALPNGEKVNCRSLHGRYFAVDDPTHTLYMPPIHPNCRCSVFGRFGDFSKKDVVDKLREIIAKDARVVNVGAGLTNNKQENVRSMSTNSLRSAISSLKGNTPDSLKRKHEVEAELARRRQKDEAKKGRKAQEDPKNKSDKVKQQLQERNNSKRQAVKQRLADSVKQRLTSLLVNRQIGKVFDTIEVMHSIALDLKANELTVENSTVDLYTLADGTKISKAIDVNGFIAHDLTEQVGDLVPEDTIGTAVDFLVKIDARPIRGGVKGFIADKITSFASNYLGDKATNTKIEALPVISEKLEELARDLGDNRVLKLRDAIGGYTINNLSGAMIDLADTDNWGFDQEGKIMIRSEMLGDIAQHLEPTPEMLEKWEKVQEQGEKYVEFVKERSKQIKKLKDNIHDDFGEDIQMMKNRFLLKEGNDEEKWQEYMDKRTNQAINASGAMIKLVNSSDIVRNMKEEFSNAFGGDAISEQERSIAGESKSADPLDDFFDTKALTNTTTTEVIIPTVIDGGKRNSTKAGSKLSKLSVRYRGGSKTKNCGKCRYYSSQTRSGCSKVKGKIDQGKVCDKFK